ncbi:MAG: DUF2804 domain-containing protein [Spirochaetaceae bacterium]|jgi:hypothetical protein|nr:DUF2804 domain-containing protein [Spirochaetaceae bacterium]
MYTREFSSPESCPVKDGIPLQGTWKEAFGQINLLDIKGAKDWKIREWQSFGIEGERFFLSAILFDAKLFSILVSVFYDKVEAKISKTRKLIPSNMLSLPSSLANSYIDVKTKQYSFRIHEWLDARNVRFDLNLAPVTAHLKFILSKGETNPLVTSLLIDEKKPYIVYKNLSEIRGDIVINKDEQKSNYYTLDPKKTSGLFCDFKAILPHRTSVCWANAHYFDAEGRRIGFSLGDMPTRDSYKNNENAFWINGSLTPLPPVQITFPNGFEKEWVIQDMEGMVDLTFKPIETISDSLFFGIARCNYITPLGIFNGVLLTAKGEAIQIKNILGMGTKLYFRG